MADIDLVIRAHLRGERELNKAERKLWRIAAAAKAADNNLASMAGATGKLQKDLKRASQTFTRVFTDWDKVVRGFGTMITKVIGFATKFFVVEFGLMSASMIAWHALLKIGRWLMKGYHGAIKMLAGAAAGAAAALSVLSAAIREQQAAMFSYKGLSMNYKELRGGIAAVRSEMRGMARDASMNAMGIENLNAIFAGSMQRGTFNRSLAKGLLDIGSAGQPLQEAAKWIGEIVGMLTDPEIQWHELETAFKNLGPVGERAMKKLRKEGVDTVSELNAAIRSGNLSIIAGVEGQYDAVAGTFMSRLKSAFSVVRTDFADLGDAFMADTKVAFEEIAVVFRRLFFRIRGQINQFGKGGFLGTLVSTTEALERGMVKLVSKWLPQAAGMFGRIADWWDRFLFGWNKMVASMAPLMEGTKILEEMFMRILRPMGDYVSTAFENFNISLQNNKDTFLEFGDAVGALLSQWMDLQTVMKDMFIEAMPFISRVLDGLGTMVELFTKLVEGFERLVGGVPGAGGMAGFAPAFAMMGMRQMGKQLAGTQGTLVPGGLNLQQLGTVAMNAQTVHLMGPGGIHSAHSSWGGSGGPLPRGTVAGQMATPAGGGPTGGGRGGAAPQQMVLPGMGVAGVGGVGFASARAGGGGMGPGPAAYDPRTGQYAPLPGAGQAQMALHGANSPAQVNRILRAGGQGVYGQPGIRGAMARGWLASTTPYQYTAQAGMAPQSYYQRARARTWGRLTGSAAAQRTSQISRSMGARMGVGMGMGILGGMMPEEAQGSMALGSMVSMIDPRLGMAVGLGGAAIKSKTAAGGALTGAGAGAALGAYGGPMGIAIGAVVGGIIGSIIGAGGARREMARKARESAGDTANEIWAGMLGGIEDVSRQYGRAGLTGARVRRGLNLDRLTALQGRAQTALDAGGTRYMSEDATGDLINDSGVSRIDSSGQMIAERAGITTQTYSAEHQSRRDAVRAIYRDREILGIDMSHEELQNNLEMPAEFLSETLSLINAKVGAAQAVTDKYTNRMDMFQGVMGKTEIEILAMADAVGVNLYDATMDTTEMFKKLSAGMLTTRNNIDTLFATSAASTFDLFGQKISRDQATIGMDESARQAREMINRGEFGNEEALAFMQEQMGFGSDLFEGDRMAAANALVEMFNPEGGLVWGQTSGQLEGDKYRDAIMTPEVQAILAQYTEAVLADNIAAMQGLVTGNLGMLGFTNAGGFSDWSGITGEQRGDLTRLFEGTGSLGQLFDDDGNVAVSKRSLQGALFEILGPGFQLADAPTTAADVAALDMNTAAATFGTSVGEFETAVVTLVERLGIQGAGTGPHSDTSSPMAGTMAAHARISQGLAGKRRITSGQRNFALGSSRSDHFTGRALDLVGSNLGGYASRVNAGGGFAEMHGMGDTRHLHAVPAGDSGSPRGGGGGQGGSYNYTINVTGGPNANANEVANLVMAQIQNTERSHRERS